MKNLILSISLTILFCPIIHAQTLKKTTSTAKISLSQKTGDNSYEEEYTLVTEFDETNLKFKTREDGKYTEFNTKKLTEKYVIGEESGNYAFYNIEKEQLYRIDYFASRYMVFGYGKDYSSLKETAIQVLNMLKEGKTQKDAIAHLIKQADYDF